MRIGSLIRLKPDYEERYIILHRHTFPGVLDRIRKSHIRNYSIFLWGGILFSYYEYVGSEFDQDMARIGEDPVTQDWWKLTDPMQEPLADRKDGEWWALMKEIFHWDEKHLASDKVQRAVLTARVAGDSDDSMIESLKTTCSSLFATPVAAGVQNFSAYHRDQNLFAYFEYGEVSFAAVFERLQEALKVGNGLDWQPMKEVFHTD